MNGQQICTMESGVSDCVSEVAKTTPKGTFPLDTLPTVLKNYTIEAAHSLSVAPEMIVLPVLAVIGAAIGNSRSIQLKDDYQESAAIYGAVVAETGSMKSPSLGVAVKPIQELETATRRTWTSDVTVEALGPLLAENPQGLILIKDELAGLVTSLNQYKSGKGSDRQFYLSAWSGSALRVDRKGGGGHPGLKLSVPKPFLSVIGCIPPDVLPSLKPENDAEDGFVERLLFAWPKAVPVRWSEESISKATREAFHGMVQQLGENDWPGRPTPMPLRLTPEAQVFWQQWHDGHMGEAESVSSQHRGFYSKLKGYCARLALIHALALDHGGEVIPEASVRAAARQIDYFKGEAIKVVDRLCRSVGRYSQEVERAREAILKGVKKHGGLTRRDAQRLQNCNASTFVSAWESLITPPLTLSHADKYILSPYRPTDRQSSPGTVPTDRQPLSLDTVIPTIAPREAANTHGGTT